MRSSSMLTVREERGGGPSAGSGMNLRDFAGVLGDRSLLLFSGIAALMQLVLFATVMSFTTDYVKNEIGTGGSELAFLSVIYSVSGVLGSYWIRTRFSDRMPRGAQLAASFALLAVYCASVPNTDSLALIYFIQFIGGFGQSVAMTTTMALALSDVIPKNRSAAMGIYQSIYGIGMTLGPVVMGRLIDLTGRFRTASYFIVLICVAGIAWCLLCVKNRRSAAG